MRGELSFDYGKHLRKGGLRVKKGKGNLKEVGETKKEELRRNEVKVF